MSPPTAAPGTGAQETPVRYWDYRAEYRADRDAILAAVDRVFSSGRLILGSEVEDFERSFAGYCGAAFGVGVASGTDAIFLALLALGVGTGHEVVTAANTPVPTVAAIRAAGARPVLVDVEEDTFLMDVGGVERAASNRVRCIVPVHLFGQAVDLEPILRLAASRGAFVVEDCAQAAGATYRGRRVGSFGNAGAFSFYPTKVLGAFGDAGMTVTSDPELHARLRRLRFYGMDRRGCAEEEGYNSRLDEVQAALLRHRLGSLDAAVERRKALARAYEEGLRGTGDVRLPVTAPGRSHQYYVYTVKTAHRDRLRAHLAACGVETRINYATPVHLMRGYAFLGYRPGSFPVTERLAAESLSLPMHPGLSADEVGRVVEGVRAFFR